VPIDGAPVLGNADAPVTIVAFNDFECPFCLRGRRTLDALRARYGDRIRIVFRHLPLPIHDHARDAAMAAAFAYAERGDAGFWAMHDVLFENQDALEREDLAGYARQIGLDPARLTRALDEESTADVVERDLRLGHRFGASGTPTFFINGRVLIGAQRQRAFEAIIDEQLTRAAEEARRGAPAARMYETLTASGQEAAVWREHHEPDPNHVRIAVPDDSPRRGAADARVVVQVWSDFQCPYCSDEAAILIRLSDAHPEIALVYRHLPLRMHRHAMPAALAAVEVHRQRGNDAFWTFHNRLFAHQDSLSPSDLVEHARAVGADPEGVRRAIVGETHRGRIEEDMAAILETELRVGTPAILVGERMMVGAVPYDELERAVQAAATIDTHPDGT
jgi:protein-disulfide isomerase